MIIAEQNSKPQYLMDKQAEIPPLEETIEKMKAENDMLNKKLSFTRRATEQKIIDNISNEDFYREDPHLVCVLSATLDEEEFDLVGNTEDIKDEPIDDLKLTHRSRKDQFMSSIENKVDKSSATQQERLLYVKNQVLDKIKSTKLKNIRRRHDSVSSSVGSKRGLSPSKHDQTGPSSSRPRTASSAGR